MMKRLKTKIISVLTVGILVLELLNVPLRIEASGASIKSDLELYANSSVISISYTGADAANDSWIGIYKSGTIPGKTPALAFHYVKTDTGSTGFTPDEFTASQYSPQKGLPLTQGRYTAYLFGDNGYSRNLAQCEFRIGGDNPVYSFEVLSDLHVNEHNKYMANDKLNKALTDVTRYAPLSQDLFINGDAVDDTSCYSELQKAVADMKEGINQNGYLPNMTFNLGNHELFTTPVKKFAGSYQKKLKNFTSGISKIKLAASKVCCFKDYSDKPYFVRDSEHQHLVFLAADGYPVNKDDVSHYSDEEITWADTTIGSLVTKYPGEPVFVFLHETLQNTVAGSSLKYIDNDTKLKACLTKYPNVILFTSHTHGDVRYGVWGCPEKQSLVTKQMTILNTASVGDIYQNGVNIGHTSESQGFHVDVYKDSVVVRVRDFSTEQWIAERKIML